MSAGEAQLLAFTRLLLKDPGLVILDEAASRLDPITEQRLERAINRLLQPTAERVRDAYRPTTEDHQQLHSAPARPQRNHHRPPPAHRAARRRHPDSGGRAG